MLHYAAAGENVEIIAVLILAGADVNACSVHGQTPLDCACASHCFEPYECPYHAHCTRDAVLPDYGIDGLPRLAAGRRAQLEAAGIEEIRDIPDDFPLTRLQDIVRRAIREDRPAIHGDVAAPLPG